MFIDMQHAVGYVVLLLLFNIPTHAQIRITELLASNASINADSDSIFSDWVELHNEGNTEVDLKGYYLTDNFKNPTKWQFTTSTIISPQGYLLIWCDGKNKYLHTNFNLSASGEQIGIFSPHQEIVDTLSFGPQFVNISLGRLPEAPSSIRFFMQPTPGAANTTQSYAGCANQLEILTPGGFFNNPVQVKITQDLGGEVHYTLDGSEPTSSSNIYTEPIEITKTTVLRARIFQQGLIPGKIISSTYFINEGFEKHHLPVVSISTNSANFWDSKKGIYTQNFKPDWEVPVNIELFENNGSDRAAFNEMAGIKINGLYSWQLPQKMLGVYFKKQYGEGKLAYQLFFDNSRSTFDNFSLRASGNDWSNTLFRDGLLQQACRRGNENLDLMAFRPSIVYLNGEFLGIHNIREKVDKDYVASNFGQKKDSIDMIEGGDYVENGDMNAWNSLIALTKKDLSLQSNFDILSGCFDVENFSDYIIAQLYSKNTSITHNTMAWKTKNSGKWRWVMMDADRGFFGYSDDLLDYYMNINVWPLAKMMKNNTYKSYLCRRIADQLFTTFNPITICKQIDEHQNDIEPMMAKQIARWKGTTSSYGDAIPSIDYWYNEVEKLRCFAYGRPSVLLQNLTDYGCSKPALLSLSSFPANACTWTFNQMKISESAWYGSYPQNMPITLTAKKKAGYNFKGWRENTLSEVITKESIWRYLDDGSDQGIAWKDTTFDDSNWKTGQAPLGYKLSNIKTTISYGSNSSNKYVTTYFRKHFNITTPLSDITSFKMNLLRDDGAIVYLNGKEILSSNMPLTNINYKTLAPYACSELAQTTYATYDVPITDLKEGDNVFAVEVHQASVASSDLSFDLESIAEQAGNPETYVSNDETCEFSLQGNRSMTAVYESNGQNLVPDSMNTDFVFYKAKSPYIVQGDVYIKEGATLRIEPGVQVWMSPNTHFYVHGSIQAEGLPTDSILFRLNPAYNASNSWGALCFIHASDTTRMSYLELRNASNGPMAYNCVAAISAFDAALRLDHILLQDIDSNPVAVRYGDVVLSNSSLHSNVIGDLINVKYGKAKIVNCRFKGNNKPDGDGIDFDGVKDGFIKNVTVSDFEGSNNDAIDLGGSTGIKIDSIMAYRITDKGVSVGQRSSVIVSHSTFIKTNLGVCAKDSSHVTVRECTFFSVGSPIACYEKIFGRAGGNADVYQSIMSNSYDKTISCDNKSNVYISNCLSDNDTLSQNHDNLFGDPEFVSPAKFDIHIKKPFALTIGSNYLPMIPEADPTIVEICYNTSSTSTSDRTEYVCIYNPRNEDYDISNCSLSEGVKFVFPEGSIIPSHGTIFIAQNKDALKLDNDIQIYNWTEGKLSNEGEKIRLNDPFGLILDQVCYSPNAPWPSIYIDGNAMSLGLSDYSEDNHFAKYWYAKTPTHINDRINMQHYFSLNPASGIMTMHLLDDAPHLLEVYSLSGQKLLSMNVINGQSVNLAGYTNTGLLVSVCGKVETVVVR